MKTKWILAIVLIAALLIAGCVGAASDDAIRHTRTVWSENLIGAGVGGADIIKITIPEDNVTCYIYEAGYSGGMSCLRDEATP
jgi:hypothetical protein